MEKNNLGWLAVRGLGIYFASKVFIFIMNFSVLILSMRNFGNNEDFIEKMELTMLIPAISTSVITILVFSFLSYYCLRKGEFFHKLLMYKRNENT